MKNKKLIIICTLIVVLIIAVASVLCVLDNKSNKNDDEDEEEFKIWEQLPFESLEEEDEISYSSFSEAFSEVIQNKIYKLKADSVVKGNRSEIISAYITEKNNPTAVLYYVYQNDEYRYLILKYKDNTLYELDIDSSSCELLIYDDCDLIVGRSEQDSENTQQIIYDVYENDYCAVKTKSYSLNDEESMNEGIAEYNGTATSYSLFSSVAVAENPIDYLGDSLNVTFAKE